MKRLTLVLGPLAVLSLTSSGGAITDDVVTIGAKPFHRYEWRASTFTRSAQTDADLAVNGKGGTLVVWSSRRQQGGRYGVYGQRFTAEGVALGGETALNLWTDSHQRTPTVAFGPGGRAWAVWESHGQDAHAGSIVARRFDAQGTGGDEVLINEQWRGHQHDPVVCVAADGSALFVWTSSPGTGPDEIRVRVISPSGTAGPELSLGTGSSQRTPAALAAPGGGFAVVYAETDERNRPAAIRLQLVSTDGRIGEVIDVAGPDACQPLEPAVAAGGAGFAAAWLERDVATGDHIVMGRLLDARGCPSSEPLAVSRGTPGPISGAAVAASPDGRFAVAFNGADGDGAGIFCRLFNALGAPLGGSFRLTRHWAGDQRMRAAAGTRRLTLGRDGSLLCAWDGDGGFGDSSSVNVTLLSPRRLEDGTRGVTGLILDSGGPQTAAQPHEPPTFDPRDIDDGERRVTSGQGGMGFTGIFNTGWTPPDPHMGVGPDHVVVMTNGAIAFFTKDGTLTFQDEIENTFGFWGEVGATGFVFDPEVLYDELSGRFFAMAAEAFAPGNTSFVLVAVSDDSNPNGTWHKYRFNTTALAGNLFDSPNIGVDADTVYITGDGFGFSSNYPVYTFDKASLLAGLPPAVSNEFELPTTTQSAGIPPVSFDDPPALYMIEHREGGSNTTVRLIALQDPLGTPSITTTTLVVPAYGPPEDPPQMGTSVRPNTFDARFWNVAYRNGSLWATHHINSDRVLGRWYEIAMNGWPDSGVDPVLVQSGDIDPGPSVRTFFTSITVDDHGNAAMTYARSAPTEFISMATSFRYATDPLGTFQSGVIQQTSTGPYTQSRWGDYSAVNVDPVDGITLWAHHEYADGGSWRTWVASFTPDFHPADLNFDGVVGIDDMLILLANWGDCPKLPAPCLGDLDGDGEVEIQDFLLLLASWTF